MPRRDPRKSEEFVREELNPPALEAELRHNVDAEVRFDAGSRAMYSTDASNYRQIPIGVVVPRTAEAVVKTVAICRRFGAPIVSRGGGTALSGQSCNVAVVIDHSKYLNRILEIDPERRIARVEPGVILDHLRTPAQKTYRLTYGPDPATHNHCTFGGMIGNNSCGIHSVMAGRTADNVEEMEVLTYDGLRMRVGPTSARELAEIIAAGGRRGEIYAAMKSLADRHADLIRRRYPRIPRRVSGYNLDELLPENGFHVARALVGSESTLVTVLAATVRLVYSYPGRALLVLGYPDVFSAADHVPQLLRFRPIGLEGLDELLIEFMKKKGLHPQDVKLLPEGKGWLIVEFGGRDRKEADDRARDAMAALAGTKNPPSMKLYDDPEEERKVWEVRESGLGATANVPGMPLSWPGWEDAAVPPERVGDYLREFRALLDRHKLIASLYGHFGDGCIHCRISFDVFTHEGIANFMRFIDGAADLVVRYGGSFSAEHGDGQSKAVFLPRMYGPELIEAFREFKSIWDPDWKMNPGKVVDPYLPDDNLRLGTDYRPWNPETHFRFPRDDGSMHKAALRCVGVGKCRRTDGAFMCPSFQVTREEKHTTRGRARILFEMFRGDFIKDGWRSREVREALDLCLACKGCRTDCPVNVDMATYKAEFLSHHYRHRPRPRAAYSMGLIGFWAGLGSRMPRAANVLSQALLLRRITKAVAGIARQRPIPAFARQTFTSWYRARDGRTREDRGQAGPVVLIYPDIFNDVFFPGVLQAATFVLQRLGYRVLIPDGKVPAVRPPLDYGFVERAGRHMKEAISLLRPYAAKGVPIVFLEPSTASVFRDELPEMFPNDQDGHRIKGLSCLLSEFVDRENFELPKLTGKAVFHAHCHQKAVLSADAARRVLARMGLAVEEPEPGCCGVAGSFGFESDHYEISRAIGEQNLLPAVRRASGGTYIIAEGFSCRTQIMDGTRRVPMHISELLHYAFEKREAEKGEPGRRAA